MKRNSTGLRVRLPALIFTLEVVIVILYVVFVTYDDSANAVLQNNQTKPMENLLYQNYSVFADIQVMIFIGFGCLLAFFRRYGFGGMVFNFLTATFAIQWAILFQGFFQFYHDGKIHLGVMNLINAEFACAVVLISFGAVLGKTSPVQLLVFPNLYMTLSSVEHKRRYFEKCYSVTYVLQYIIFCVLQKKKVIQVMAMLEIPVFAITEWAVLKYLKINDAGGSILIHLFACYFGLGVTFVLYRPSLNEGHPKEATSYQSDLLSLIGTLFLWVFWPSFNSALTLKGDDQHRAVLHTFIGLSASTITAFALSTILSKNGKISMADVQNVTLAGGVTVGASVDMMISPGAAYALGILGCIACMLGYRYLSPFLARRLRIQDQCGIHNLHGLTGLISSLAGICAILLATEETYGPSLYQTFSYRAPMEGDPQLEELRKLIPDLEAGLGRSAQEQALFQLAAVVGTIAASAVGGFLTGTILKLPYLASPTDENCFDDELFFDIPQEYNQQDIWSHVLKDTCKTDVE